MHRKLWLASIAIAAVLGCSCQPTAVPLARPTPDSQRTEREVEPAVVLKPHDAVFDSRFHNTQPGVKYVAEERCAECHAEIAAAFRQHPMGQSLEAVVPARELARAPLPAQPLVAGNYAYEIAEQDSQLWHREEQRSSNGETLQTIAHPVAYAVGAGSRGRSYLIRRGDHLLMSPVTWYPSQNRWGLSPGYERNNSHFYRPIVSGCLYCHAGEALPIETSRNRYEKPIFAEHAIGCQRCHGPGELHVQKHSAAAETKSNEFDATIVNPAHLSPELALDVCTQCHLGGVARIIAPGRKQTDYRPGLRLSNFQAIYIERNEQATKFVGHVEQMQASGCFVGSQGKLHCTSCHDPHRVPATENRVAYFKAKCQNCHSAADACRETSARREATTPADNCLHCHMPEQKTEIQHAAITDHRIPRRPLADVIAPKTAEKRRLVPFDRTALARPGYPVQRNLALATVQAWDYDAQLPTAKEVHEIVKLLEPYVAAHPADYPAREALALCYERMQQNAAAAGQFEKVLAEHPEREFSRAGSARNLSATKRYREAAAHWEHAVQLNPWMPLYRAEWGTALANQARWEEAHTVAEKAIELAPDSMAARQLLVETLLALNRPEGADRAFEELVRLSNTGDQLREWYRAHPLRKLSEK